MPVLTESLGKERKMAFMRSGKVCSQRQKFGKVLKISENWKKHSWVINWAWQLRSLRAFFDLNIKHKISFKNSNPQNVLIKTCHNCQSSLLYTVQQKPLTTLFRTSCSKHHKPSLMLWGARTSKKIDWCSNHAPNFNFYDSKQTRN